MTSLDAADREWQRREERRDQELLEEEDRERVSPMAMEIHRRVKDRTHTCDGITFCLVCGATHQERPHD